MVSLHLLGYRNENWKDWKLPDGTGVLIGGGFAFKTDENGDTYVYPQGDTSVPPSGKLPKGGFILMQSSGRSRLTKIIWMAGKILVSSSHASARKI